MNGFLQRPLVGNRPYLWLNATYLKQREGGQIVSVAVIIAVALKAGGRREMVSLHIRPSEVETFWSAFLKSPIRPGLRGVQLVISDAHVGLTGAIRRGMGASWHRCRVHWGRKGLAHVPKGQQSMGSATLRHAFFEPDRVRASQALRHVADQLRPESRRLATFHDESEVEVGAYINFRAQHRTKILGTDPLVRVTKEGERRAQVVGMFPNETEIMRLIDPNTPQTATVAF